MSAQAGRSREKLAFIDPAEFTPHFAWKNSPREKDVEHVFCEGVDLHSAAASFGTPTYLYSKRAITDAYREFDRGLGKIPHTICFAVKSNGNLSLLQLELHCVYEKFHPSYRNVNSDSDFGGA